MRKPESQTHLSSLLFLPSPSPNRHGHQPLPTVAPTRPATANHHHRPTLLSALSLSPSSPPSLLSSPTAPATHLRQPSPRCRQPSLPLPTTTTGLLSTSPSPFPPSSSPFPALSPHSHRHQSPPACRLTPPATAGHSRPTSPPPDRLRRTFLSCELLQRQQQTSSRDFAFGFQPVGAAGEFLLAIWFNNKPEKTILWSSNSNQIAESGSKLELTTDGVFVLNDPSGNQIWSPDAAGVAYAAMLDTRNLVLATITGLVVWQSFDSPTDTLLPTQNLNKRDTIIARYSESNYSSGRFLLAMQNDGNLVFYKVNILGNENGAYRASNTVGSGYRVEFYESGLVYLVAENGTILSQIFSGNSSWDDFYQRVTLDYDGVLRKYAYARSSSSIAGRWPKAWSILSFEPSNICTNAGSLAVGSGICGFNSVCQSGAADGVTK